MVQTYPMDRDIERGISPDGPWSSRHFRQLAQRGNFVRQTANLLVDAATHATTLATEHLPPLARNAYMWGVGAAYVQAASNNFAISSASPKEDVIIWDDNKESPAQQYARLNSGLVQPQSYNPGRASNLATLAKKRQPKPGPGPAVKQTSLKRKRPKFLEDTPPSQKKKWWRLADSQTPSQSRFGTPTQSFTQVSQNIRNRIQNKFKFLRGRFRSRRNYTRAKLLFARTRLQRKALRKSAQFNSRRYRRLIRHRQRFKRRYG